MNDLLGSLKGAGGSGFNLSANASKEDIEAGPPPPAPPPADDSAEKQMAAFFKAVSEIKELLAQIKHKQRKLEDSHEVSKTLTRSAEVQSLREVMTADTAEVTTLAKTVQIRLEQLDKSNAAAMKRKGGEPGSSQERTRTAITAALRNKLKELMASFDDLRKRLHQEYREVVERRVYTFTGQKVSEEEVERMIDTGESETIFQKAILEQGRGHVEDTLAEIQERHDAVQELERSLMDLHQIFLDLAVLVEAQGEQLDNIEANVAKSVDFVQKGTTMLIDAKRYQKKTRKLMCCALITMLIIIAIIVVVAIRPWKH
ncbi:hypothetical protein WJX73_004427 [Symbiochloris irregularis]|uniref:t-SNARE coiled-coil homology domain-containing protein n=1 Tax=Symbiochloris irregularis TaxID=706552 RepID=A0AAW1NWB6_9CHLO